MEQSFFDLIYFLHCPGLAETFLDVLLSSVPIWLAVMIGLVIGRLPNTKRLNLEAIGVELDEMGAVKVDEFSRTNVPSIWAVGDVTNRLNLTPVALMEGTCFSVKLFLVGNLPNLTTTMYLVLYSAYHLVVLLD
ncbi:hypothetical protein CsSME_00001949 [Camellia sinensis var. sinensis]